MTRSDQKRRRLWGVLLLALSLCALGAAPAASAPKKKARPKVVFGPQVSVVLTTADLSRALSRMPALRFSSSSATPPGLLIRVRDDATYQRFKGSGGAMTDTSAWLIEDQLRPGTRAWLMRRLFSSSGIGLNLIRAPMGASDFTATRGSYSYDDLPSGQTDPTLGHFSIAHDVPYVIPALRQAMATATDPFLLANPWSPPGWMKSTGQLGNPGDNGLLLNTSFGPLALYFVRFLQAYAQRGVTVSAVTPQNEPGQQSTYPGLNVSEPQEETFVRSYLAPALRAAHLSTEIYGYDGPWSRLGFEYSLARSPAAADLAGMATHCYFGTPAAMAAMHRINPHLDELESECSSGVLPFSVSELEISSLRSWASGVMLWNFALDQFGGPVQPPNYGCLGCTGIVTINTNTHQVAFGRTYYELGQLSKFVHPGAIRIGSTSFASYAQRTPYGDIASPSLDDVAFRNRDGSHVLEVYNGTRAPIPFGVEAAGKYFSYSLDGGATVTFTWKP